ncbi:hypothetical protein AMTR_s00050p00108240 [Amborella trichopoda]|uniref:Uncharacterized protein n=1 Tax=Amborella trichopoda TaxID=13333 RepID=W1PXC3_AMBTC|nr:hypothetical protein AMTR_s00050p00108240 [Amborella trichopoda]
MKTLSEWELEVKWGHLSLKMSSQATTRQHLPRGLVMASSSGIPLVFVIGSSSEEENLSPRSRNSSQKPYKRMEVMGKKDKILKGEKLEFTKEIVVVEENIPIANMN